jgi:hypothetical protein
MAQDTTKALTAGTWTQLTDADVTEITFQNVSQDAIRVKVTAGATAPTTFTGSIVYYPGQGERKVAIADLAPGVSSPTRVYAFCNSAASVMVSHA